MSTHIGFKYCPCSVYSLKFKNVHQKCSFLGKRQNIMPTKLNEFTVSDLLFKITHTEMDVEISIESGIFTNMSIFLKIK